MRRQPREPRTIAVARPAATGLPVALGAGLLLLLALITVIAGS